MNVNLAIIRKEIKKGQGHEIAKHCEVIGLEDYSILAKHIHTLNTQSLEQ